MHLASSDAMMPGRQRRIRILQIVGGLDRAGTETWLLNLRRHTDRERLDMDFVVHGDPLQYAYSAELLATGSQIFSCEGSREPLKYGHNLRRLIAKNGPYDVVHAHLQLFNGIVLRAAKRSNVALRIGHSHNASEFGGAAPSVGRTLYQALMKRWISQYATHRVAVSHAAGEALFGREWHQQRNTALIHCGIDLSPFETSADRAAVRMELGIPSQAVVLGNVGRLVEQKNHALLTSVYQQLARMNKNIYLLLVGEGPLRTQIETVLATAGAGNARLVGSRQDVARLLAAMDVFLLTSHYEGLGLAGIEAQAAGVPCVFGPGVPEEADVVPQLVRRVSSRDDVADWSQAAMEAITKRRNVSRSAAYAAVAKSDFNIVSSASRTCQIYQQASNS